MQPRKTRPTLRLVGDMRGEDHPSLSAMIRDQLRASILNGSLKPGQLLRQEELAERFNTSRVPLREALQSLQAEGLVLLRPRRGYAVFEATTEDLLESLRLRVLVEAFGGYAGTSVRTARDAANLATILGEMEKVPARITRESQRIRWWSLDRDFHRTIFGAGNNIQLCQLFDNLTARLDPYLLAEPRLAETRDDAMEDHRQIAAAFAKGDADQVAILSRRHAEALAARFLAGLEQRGTLTPGAAQTILDLGPAAAIQATPPPPAEARRRCNAE